MKNLIFTIVAVLLVTACGKAQETSRGACADKTLPSGRTIAGTWVATTGGVTMYLNFDENCSATLQQKNVYGQLSDSAVFTWDAPQSGAIPIAVSSTPGGTYFPGTNGSQTVTFNDFSTAVVFQFDSNQVSYLKR